MAGDLDLVRTQRHVFESSLDASTKLVALALLDHWSRTTETFPSVARLAAWTTLSRVTVMSAISKLEGLGAIIVTRRNGASNRYSLGQMSLLPVAQSDRSTEPTGETKPVKPPDRSSGQTGQATGPQPVKLLDPTSQATGPEGTQQGTQQGTQESAPTSEPPRPASPRAPSSAEPKASRRKRARQPETALSPDWQPTDAHRAYAAKYGLDVELEADALRGFAEGRTAVSWNGTFTTRLANQVKWGRERKANGWKGKPTVQRGGTIRVGSSSWLDDPPKAVPQQASPKLSAVR